MIWPDLFFEVIAINECYLLANAELPHGLCQALCEDMLCRLVIQLFRFSSCQFPQTWSLFCLWSLRDLCAVERVFGLPL